MSDLFHDRIPFDFIQQVFSAMEGNARHTFQVLTKRSERLRELGPLLEWSENIWMGATIENNDYVGRAEDLRSTIAAIKFLSLEPLLGPVPDLDLRGIDWVIVGGESGPGAREMRQEWVLEVKEKCEKANAAFFFKQWGGVNKKKNGRILQGRTWDDYPQVSQSRLETV